MKFHAVFVKLSGCLFFWRGKRERVKFFHGIGWFFILFFPIWFQGLDDFRMRPQVILSQNLGFSFPQGEICFFSLEGFLSFWVKRRFSAFQVVATFSMASCDLSGCPDEWFANMTYSQDESPEKWSDSSTVGESSPNREGTYDDACYKITYSLYMYILFLQLAIYPIILIILPPIPIACHCFHCFPPRLEVFA